MTCEEIKNTVRWLKARGVLKAFAILICYILFEHFSGISLNVGMRYICSKQFLLNRKCSLFYIMSDC